VFIAKLVDERADADKAAAGTLRAVMVVGIAGRRAFLSIGSSLRAETK
jgi:hypothetical protein